MHTIFIIGLGQQGLTHARLLSQRNDISIVGGFDSSPKTRIECANTLTFPIYHELRTALIESKPSCILIATPPKVRYELFKDFIELPFLKRIILEKPMALSLNEGLLIQQFCDTHAISLHIVYQSRFCEEFITLKNAISTNRLGDIISIQAACYGNVLNQGAHNIDLIHWLVSHEPILWVDATANNNIQSLAKFTSIAKDYEPDIIHPAPLWSSIYMRTAANIDIFMTCGILDSTPIAHLGPWLQRRIRVIGSKGCAEAHLASHYKEFSITENSPQHFFTSPAQYYDAYQKYYDFVFNSTQPTNDYLPTLATLMACLESGKQRHPIKVSTQTRPLCEPSDATKTDYPLISVIIPMETYRNNAEKSVLSWTQQNCGGHLFEIIIALYSHQTSLEETIRKIIRPSDKILLCTASNEIELFHLGAKAAKGKYLIFTESHCIAESHLIQEAVKFFNIEPHAGFIPRTLPICNNAIARMEAELYNESFKNFIQPSAWAKITLHALGISKEIYFAIDGLQYQYNRFATWIMGANLRERGYTLAYAPAISVFHLYADSFASLDNFISETISGESLFNEECKDRNFYNKYFYSAIEIASIINLNIKLNQYFCKNTFKLLFESYKAPYDLRLFFHKASILIKSIFNHLSALSYNKFQQRLKVYLIQLKFYFSRKNTIRAFKLFKKYYHEKILLYRIEHALAKKKSHSCQTPEQMHYWLSKIDEKLLYGFYSIESFEEKSFRWSQSICAVKLMINPGNYQATIHLLPVRIIAPQDRIAIFLNNQRIHHITIDKMNSQLMFNFSTNKISTCEIWLSIFIKPWHFSERVPDERILGLPIQQLCLDKIN